MASVLVRDFLVIFLFIGANSWPARQKPKFEVAHKAGSMDVLASQFTADVKLKSDTVNVDVNPGDMEVPLQAKAPRITHVYQYAPPVLGKKSDIVGKTIVKNMIKNKISNISV